MFGFKIKTVKILNQNIVHEFYRHLFVSKIFPYISLIGSTKYYINIIHFELETR